MRYGKLYKVKEENDATAKIEMLPEHCIIDNDNQLTIEDVDKSFYIEMAKKRINDFIGIKPIKNKTKKEKTKMATNNTTKAPQNVYQKLLRARAMFLSADPKKSGKNMQLAFKYFELDDIVPIATKIFEEVGLISIVSFENDIARMSIVNTDNPNEGTTFTAPFKPVEPIVSNAGKQVTNEMQALGSSITYMRRYLYMIALDICEPDGIDVGAIVPNATQPTPTVVTPKVEPVEVETPKVEQVEKPLTDANGNASDIQINQLKSVLKQLKDKDSSKEELIMDLAIETQNFTVISKADCEKLIIKIGEMLKGE
jgi:hypothetical protein